jgi:hypothetical protein
MHVEAELLGYRVEREEGLHMDGDTGRKRGERERERERECVCVCVRVWL